MFGVLCRGFYEGGGFCPGGFVQGVLSREGGLSGGVGFVRRGFVRGVLSGGVLSSGVLSGGFVRGVLSGGGGVVLESVKQPF